MFKIFKILAQSDPLILIAPVFYIHSQKLDALLLRNPIKGDFIGVLADDNTSLYREIMLC